MKGMFQKMSLVALLAVVLLAGCDKDGKNGWLYSEGKDFQPISGLTGESGYGYALLRWNLPEKVDQLTMIDVSWVNTEDEITNKKLTHFEDSLWLDLEMKDYTFKVTSCGIAGEIVTDSVTLHVPDWRTEPLEVLQNMVINVIENGVYTQWTRNNSRSYANTTFHLYNAQDELIGTVVRTKDESVTAQFADLDYETDYVLRYYSENIAGMRTDSVEYLFTTDEKADNVPNVTVWDRVGEQDAGGNVFVTTVYAYSTEIKWENTDSNVDSIRITFNGLNQESCEFRFKASDEKGHLTLLPGGEVTLAVSAKMKNSNEWSGAKAQTITTKNPGDKYVFRTPNTTTGDGTTKIGLSYSSSYKNGQAVSYLDLLESHPKEITIVKKPKMVDEIELFAILETLIVGDANQPVIAPDGSGQVAPTMEEFINLVSHLKKLKTLRIKKGFGGSFKDGRLYTDVFVEEFSNQAKYPGLTVVVF